MFPRIIRRLTFLVSYLLHSIEAGWLDGRRTAYEEKYEPASGKPIKAAPLRTGQV